MDAFLGSHKIKMLTWFSKLAISSQIFLKHVAMYIFYTRDNYFCILHTTNEIFCSRGEIFLGTPSEIIKRYM